MIEKDKTYTYKELKEIIAKASAKVVDNEDNCKVGFIKIINYAELMRVLFTDEELNKEILKEEEILKEDKENK